MTQKGIGAGYRINIQLMHTSDASVTALTLNLQIVLFT